MRRYIQLLFILCTGFAVSGKTVKQVLGDAYLCSTDSCAYRNFELAFNQIENDTHAALYDYFKFFYAIKVDQLDSADIFYATSQPQMARLKNWYLYFNSLDAKVNTLHDRGMYDEAVLVLKEGIKTAEAHNEEIEKVLLQIRLSYTYHDMGLYENGIVYGKRAKKYLDTTQHTSQLINAINAIAICFDDWGKPDSALHYHYLNVEIGLEKTSQWGASSTYNNIGNTYLKLNNYDSAEKYLKISLAVAKKAENVNQLATVLNNLGMISMKKENMEQAKFYLDSALYYAELDEFAPLEKRRDVYLSLTDFFEKMGNMAGAFKYQRLYYQYRDSMQNVKQVERLKNLEIAAAESKRSQEKAEAQLKIKNRNLWLVITAFVVFLLLAVLRQLYLKRKQEEQEALLRLQTERLRISRDLHDNIGAELTYISSVIDQKSYATKDPEKKAEYVQLSNSSRLAMSQLRETIWAIKTEEITLEKLMLKISDLSQKYTSGLGIKVDVKSSGINPVLKPARVINVFRICQEATNNAVKYSNCDTITIDANAEDDQLVICIADDGQGFDLHTIKEGYGLKNMRERAEELGGTLEIKSGPKTGTQLTLSIPI